MSVIFVLVDSFLAMVDVRSYPNKLQSLYFSDVADTQDYLFTLLSRLLSGPGSLFCECRYPEDPNPNEPERTALFASLPLPNGSTEGHHIGTGGFWAVVAAEAATPAFMAQLVQCWSAYQHYTLFLFPQPPADVSVPPVREPWQATLTRTPGRVIFKSVEENVLWLAHSTGLVFPLQ